MLFLFGSRRCSLFSKMPKMFAFYNCPRPHFATIVTSWTPQMRRCCRECLHHPMWARKALACASCSARRGTVLRSILIKKTLVPTYRHNVCILAILHIHTHIQITTHNWNIKCYRSISLHLARYIHDSNTLNKTNHTSIFCFHAVAKCVGLASPTS